MVEEISRGEYVEFDYHCPSENVQILFRETIKEDRNEVSRNGARRESINNCAERDERFNYQNDELGKRNKNISTEEHLFMESFENIMMIEADG